MSIFCDSSALVKRYADEPGADAVRGRADLIVSVIARVEVPAALWRKHRMGELATADLGVLTSAFEWEWAVGAQGTGAFHLIPVTPGILETAAAAVTRHPLRAYDAVQLASAMAARDADPAVSDFACFDDRLREAATAEGFHPLPATIAR